MPIITQKWDSAATILSTCIGKTIQDIDYDGLNSGSITIKFTNGKSITIDAQGDDMSCTIVTD